MTGCRRAPIRTSPPCSSRARIQALVTSALNGEVTFSYSPPVDLPQGRSDPRYTADLGIRYRFLENRASLRLALRDPLQLRRSGSRTQDLGYIQVGRSRESTRSAAVTLSYSFGGRGRPGGGKPGRQWCPADDASAPATLSRSAGLLRVKCR